MAEPVTMVGGAIPLLTPIVVIVAIVAIVIAWKVFKFTIKKISAVLQGIAALAVIVFALTVSVEYPVVFVIIGLGLLFGAISNIFS